MFQYFKDRQMWRKVNKCYVILYNPVVGYFLFDCIKEKEIQEFKSLYSRADLCFFCCIQGRYC